MHGTRLRIKRSVMDSGCFVDFRRITRKFIPKTIKINSFAASHQPFCIGTAEREMPERGAAHDFVPGWNARHRRLQSPPPGRFNRGKGRKGKSQCCPKVKAHHRSAIDTELSKNG